LGLNQEKKAMVKNGVQINMAPTQNLLDFTPGYSFCDINRVFAYQNGGESSLKGRM
jgi:hypothetical protein